jgi:hypothetical protein
MAIPLQFVSAPLLILILKKRLHHQLVHLHLLGALFMFIGKTLLLVCNALLLKIKPLLLLVGTLLLKIKLLSFSVRSILCALKSVVALETVEKLRPDLC